MVELPLCWFVQSCQIFFPLCWTIIAILYVKHLWDTVCPLMWLHCAWCPDWGKGAFLSAASIQKPLVVLDTRLKTEGFSELTMVTAVKYSIFLLANKAAGEGRLFSLCPVSSWRGLGCFWPWARWKVPHGNTSKCFWWSWQLTAWSLSASCVFGGGGMGAFFLCRHLQLKSF